MTTTGAVSGTPSPRPLWLTETYPPSRGGMAESCDRIVRSLRQLELKKSPSVSETLDWANTLMLLGVQNVDDETAKATSNYCAG